MSGRSSEDREGAEQHCKITTLQQADIDSGVEFTKVRAQSQVENMTTLFILF
jgi:hypothetical protein